MRRSSRLTLSGCLVDLDRRELTRDGQVTVLTPLETALLDYLADRAGTVVTRDELLREVWGYGPDVKSRAVDHTIGRLRGKLELDRAHPRHLVSAFARGYRLDLPQQEAPASGLRGRQEELAELRRWLDAPGSLLTITGPAGVGKTRLAREVLDQARTRGLETWFRCLRDARQVADVVSSIAAGLGTAVPAADADAHLGRVLADRGPALLVLDNLEQVPDGLHPVLEDWLAQAPGLHVLVTSQRALGSEPILALQPLAIDDAVALFWERAGTRDPGQDDPVRQLVRRLNCLPLAVELAAARTNLCAPSARLDLLAHRFQLRRRGDDTLAAAITWSWNLLDPLHAQALAELSLFAGGFDLAGATAVLALAEPAFVPDVLDALAARSLVQVRRDDGVRLELLESIRAFAADRLQERDDRHLAAARHAAHTLAQAEPWVARLNGPERASCLAGLAREQENLLAICRRSASLAPDVGPRAALCVDALFVERRPATARVALWQDVELGPETGPNLTVRASCRQAEAQRHAGQIVVGHAGLRQALELAVAWKLPVLAARIQANLGAGLLAVGQLNEAQDLLTAALDGLDQPWDRFMALVNLATLDWCSGRAHDAQEGYLEALALAQAEDNRRGEGLALGFLGNVRLQLGAMDDAAAAFRDAIQVQAKLDDPRGRAAAIGNLGSILLEQGQLEQAQDHLEQAAALCRRVGEVRMEAVFVGNLAITRLFQDRPADALDGFERARALQEIVGADPRGRAILLGYVAIAQAVQGRPEAAAQAFARAREALPTPRPDDAWFLTLCAAHIAHGVDANLLRTRAMRDVAQLKQTSQDARLVLALLRRRPD